MEEALRSGWLRADHIQNHLHSVVGADLETLGWWEDGTKFQKTGSRQQTLPDVCVCAKVETVMRFCKWLCISNSERE